MEDFGILSKFWEDMGRFWEVMGRFGKTWEEGNTWEDLGNWEDFGILRKFWEDMGRFGIAREDLERLGKIWEVL